MQCWQLQIQSLLNVSKTSDDSGDVFVTEGCCLACCCKDKERKKLFLSLEAQQQNK